MVNSRYLRAGISLVLLALLSIYIDLQIFVESLERLDYPAVLGALFVIAFIRVLMSIRWWCLLSTPGQDTLSLARVIKVTFIASPVATVTPAGIGGDIVRGALIKSELQSQSVISPIVADRIVGLFSMILVSATLLPFATEFEGKQVFVALMVMLVAASVMGFALASTISGYVEQNTPFKRVASIVRMGAVFANYAKGTLTKVLALSILVQLCRGYVVFLLFMALAKPVYIIDAFAFVFVLMALPITLGGLGLREMSLAYTFSLVGVVPEYSIIVGLSNHALQFVLFLPAAFLWTLGLQDSTGGAK